MAIASIVVGSGSHWAAQRWPHRHTEKLQEKREKETGNRKASFPKSLLSYILFPLPHCALAKGPISRHRPIVARARASISSHYVGADFVGSCVEQGLLNCFALENKKCNINKNPAKECWTCVQQYRIKVSTTQPSADRLCERLKWECVFCRPAPPAADHIWRGEALLLL